jgi:hypothetical protein
MKQSSRTQRPAPAQPSSKRPVSMHDGIPFWCGCCSCSCEAEPYWAELADELGIDLASDYQDEMPSDTGKSD